MCDNKYMEIAIKEAKLGIEKRHGGPFGAIIVKDGEIIAQNHNRVIETNDPTAHAEMLVIREASKILNTFDLSECILYTSCEPCILQFIGQKFPLYITELLNMMPKILVLTMNIFMRSFLEKQKIIN